MVDDQPSLGLLDQRVLVVYGQRDAIAAAGARRFESLPHVEFAVLPRIGHEIFADAPEQALERVATFLNHEWAS
jgi:pimeloyl-ACP methyl ester carboxylesterase